MKFGDGRLWLLGLVGLLAWQGWMTLTLFGPGPGLAGLLDDRPVVSGAHPFHLYFGTLGAASLARNGTASCYDPAFEAGYPKTPVFDNGSRPAELFLALAGATYRPAAYKVGLTVCCALVPLFLLASARGAGLRRGPAVLAVALGLLVWWGRPCRDSLEAGDIDLLLGGLCATAAAGMVIALDRSPGVVAWLGLLAVGALGWYAHPLLFLLSFPVLLVYYLSVGARHSLFWHLALLTAQAGALAVNAFWLGDWARSWWMRLPMQLDSFALHHRTLNTVWNSPLWGDPADRALAAALAVLALAGVFLLNKSGRRAAARVFGMGAGGLLVLAVGGIAWPPLGRSGTSSLLVPGLWFAVTPATVALTCLAHAAACRAGGGWKGAALVGALALAVAVSAYPAAVTLARRATGATSLTIGLNPERQAVVNAIRQHTTPEARILWEDRPGPRSASCWSALLPLWTERAFLGGLGSDVRIEHAFASLTAESLAGRPLKEWSDLELERFCRRYNVGWVVCWSPAAVARFRAWNGASLTAALDDDGPGCLFTLKPRSFILKGQARWLRADWRRVELADVVPEDGTVVLSLHYQTGLRVSPSRVQLQCEVDPYDPIPFVRLKVPGPVARLTLTWDSP